MDRLRGLWKRLRALVRRGVVERELDEELAFHIDKETDRLVREMGVPWSEARRAALVAFGGVEKHREAVRDVRRVPWLSDLAHDVHHALRTFRRSPGFTAAAVLTLAVGIGAATAIFGVVDAVVLTALPFDAPDRLVHVWETTPEGEDFVASEPNYLDFRDRNRTLAGLAAYRPDAFSLTGEGEPVRLRAVSATHTLFPVLRVEPVLGRGFTAAEDRPGGETRVVVLGHDFWTDRFAADPAVPGRTLLLDGEPYVVVGVLPADFQLLDVDVWVPLAPDPNSRRGDHWLSMVGRLAPGVTREQASADLNAIAAGIGAAHPEVAGWGVRVLGLDEWRVEPRFRQIGTLLLGAVGLLLLMACANVANLLLARATARQTELGIRIALGAGRGRLLRQHLTESAVLAGLGAAVGLLAGGWALGTLRVVASELIPRIEEVGMDLRVAGFAVAVALATGLAVGLLSSLAASTVDVHATLKQAGRGGSSRGQHRLREALVVAQVALGVVLLLGAGLMMRSLLRLRAVDPGFRTAHVWTVPLQLPSTGYAEPWEKVIFYNQVLERVEAIPGVVSAAATNVTPLSDWNFVNDVTPEDRAAVTPSSGFMQAAWRAVTPGYFDAAGIPLLRGRTFTSDDRYDRPRVVVVTRTLADRLWPDGDAIGKRLFWGGTTGTPWTVVGVVGDIRDVDLAAAPPPVLFLPTGHVPWPTMTLVVRAAGELPGIAGAVRAAVWSLDPNLPVPEVTPLVERRAAALAEPRFHTLLLGAFAAAALLLASVGLYGVLAFAVVQRTREIGVRMALGAGSDTIVRMLVRRGLLLTGAGVGLGLAAAVAMTRFIESLLFETPGVDPLTYLAVPGLFAAVALIATGVPARRAARVDPIAALRSE